MTETHADGIRASSFVRGGTSQHSSTWPVSRASHQGMPLPLILSFITGQERSQNFHDQEMIVTRCGVKSHRGSPGVRPAGNPSCTAAGAFAGASSLAFEGDSSSTGSTCVTLLIA